MSEEIRELGDAIQELFAGVEATVAVSAMCELLAMQSVRTSRTEAEAREKLDGIVDCMGRALKLHAQSKWGRRH
jgi:hypothetical protein